MINNPIINYIMELFKLHVFSAFLIAIVFYIVKLLMKRMYKDETIENKKILKDSILIFCITYLVMILKDNLTLLDNTKTQVFTNEPSF